MKKTILYRVLFYVGGMLLLALGISLNTRTNLGVSPLISVAFCVATLFEANIGDITFLWYVVFVLVEVLCHVIMKRYKAILSDILQIAVSMIFTRFLNLFSGLIPNMTGNIGLRVLFLMLAIALTGLGIVFTLNARFIPNPGDGIVQALSDISKKKVSTVKNVVDATCVLITLIISFVFAGKIIGVGIGTVLAVIFTGRVVAIGNRLFKEKIE